MLFWKNAKECREIMDGYGSYRGASQKPKVMWTEEQENELRTLYEEHKESEGTLIEYYQMDHFSCTHIHNAVLYSYYPTSRLVNRCCHFSAYSQISRRDGFHCVVHRHHCIMLSFVLLHPHIIRLNQVVQYRL